jgi:glycosyltransferase involved in cell wall biosynthesis
MKTSSDEPKVSVIVPNYNHAQYIEERLDSILNQSYQDFELIVLDDASSDDSIALIKAKLKGWPYRLVANTMNSGSTFRQWIKGFSLAVGEYIWIAESDDAADSHFLERLIPCLNQSSIALAYAQSVYIDSDSKEICSAKYWTDDLSRSLWSEDFILPGRFFTGNYLIVKAVMPNASAVVFRRSLLEGYEQRLGALKLCGDWLFWHHLAMQGRIAYVATPLNWFRSHEQTVRRKNQLIFMSEMIQVASVIAIQDGCLPLSAGERRQLLYNILAFWKSFGFSLLSPSAWVTYRDGMRLLAVVAGSRLALLGLVLTELLTIPIQLSSGTGGCQSR